MRTIPRTCMTAFVTLAATALWAGLLAPPAAADPGDETTAYSSNGATLATDACPGAFIQVVAEGAPGNPDDYTILFGGDNCITRSRFVGVKDDGRTVFRTDFATSSGRGGGYNVYKAYRCSVEFGVQRKNGTFYTRSILPTRQENPNCPE